MGARRGDQVISRLKEQPPEIWHAGHKVADVTVEPGLANGVASLADLYDVQWEDPETMLFASPLSGASVGRSFMIPTTREELSSIGRMMQHWAEHTQGMMGRSPDYINRSVSAFAGAAEFLGRGEPRFAQNIRRCHQSLRENDLCLTHTLIHPQANRAVGVSQQADPYLGARVKRETDAGLVIRGARMLATLPISDAIMVFPSIHLKNGDEDASYAFGFVIDNNTPGLRFICRESLDYGRSRFDHPLGSRFEEMDSLVVFDDVLVPWDNVFLYRDVPLCNEAFSATGATAHMAHQVVTRTIAKTEFLLGLISLIIDGIGLDGFQHIHEKTAEVWVNLQVLQALKYTAEAEAALNEYGVMTPAWAPLDAARNLYPRLYPRMIEIVQQIGASGLVSIPTEADVNGPLARDIQQYYQSARLDALERIQIFRLAWDVALSAFGSRQVLFERFFFGDPVRMAGAVFHGHDRRPYMERVREFLERSPEEPDRANH